MWLSMKDGNVAMEENGYIKKKVGMKGSEGMKGV